jgi:hypothetical protein
MRLNDNRHIWAKIFGSGFIRIGNTATSIWILNSGLKSEYVDPESVQ